MLRYYKVAFSVEGDDRLGYCTAIEYEGAVWIVPKWLRPPDGQYAMPERMILLSQFPHQKFDPPTVSGLMAGVDFALNTPLPKGLVDGDPEPLKERFVFLYKPNLRFQMAKQNLH